MVNYMKTKCLNIFVKECLKHFFFCLKYIIINKNNKKTYFGQKMTCFRQKYLGFTKINERKKIKILTVYIKYVIISKEGIMLKKF